MPRWNPRPWKAALVRPRRTSAPAPASAGLPSVSLPPLLYLVLAIATIGLSFAAGYRYRSSASTASSSSSSSGSGSSSSSSSNALALGALPSSPAELGSLGSSSATGTVTTTSAPTATCTLTSAPTTTGTQTSAPTAMAPLPAPPPPLLPTLDAALTERLALAERDGLDPLSVHVRHFFILRSFAGGKQKAQALLGSLLAFLDMVRIFFIIVLDAESAEDHAWEAELRQTFAAFPLTARGGFNVTYAIAPPDAVLNVRCFAGTGRYARVHYGF
jgi:hypothetical protein